MLNLIIKKICPILKFKVSYPCSSMLTQLQTWVGKINQTQTLIQSEHNNKQTDQIRYEIQWRNMKKQQKNQDEYQSKKALVSPRLFKKTNELKIKKTISSFASQKHVKKEPPLQNDIIVQRFNKNLDILTKIKNSQKLMRAINVLSQKNMREQLQIILKNFLKQQKLPEHKLILQQRKLFSKVQQLLLKNFQDVEIAREFLLTLSKCDPNLIDFASIKKIQQIEDSYTYFQNSNLKKEYLVAFGMEQKPKIIEGNKVTQIVKSEGLNLLKNQKKIENPLLRKMKTKPQIKSQPLIKQFIDTQENLRKVQHKLFGDRKLLTDHVIFQRVQNRSNQMQNKFGQNWVYAYDLPYKLLQEDARKLITVLRIKYGQIENYSLQSYHRIIQTPYSQILYVLPQNFDLNSHKNKRIEKMEIKKDEKDEKERNGKKKKEKDLVKLILQKTKKQRQSKLNRSTLIFKFKRKQDKEKFLTEQMRLYGMNFLDFKNVKFEQAQFKNIVTLSMIPWDCQSSDLIKFINKILYSMKIVVTHPNCIISSGYVFIRLANFYQAYFTKQLLHDLNYQNQVLKAQICYGPLFKNNGVYKHTFEFNHYEQLVEKMQNYRQDSFNKN